MVAREPRSALIDELRGGEAPGHPLRMLGSVAIARRRGEHVFGNIVAQEGGDDHQVRLE